MKFLKVTHTESMKDGSKSTHSYLVNLEQVKYFCGSHLKFCDGQSLVINERFEDADDLIKYIEEV